MKRTGRLSLLTLILLFGWVTVASSQTPSSRPPSPRSAASRTAAAQPQASTEPIMVGRISEVEGQLLRYVPAEKDWVATIKDAPFGLDDALYSDQDGKAEFIMPNGTWIRVGADTQIQLIALRQDVCEIDVASGVSRFFNKSQDAVIKTTTPFGYVVAPAGTTFDLYVGDESVEVIAISGTVDFVLNNDAAKYQVAAGSPSLLSDGKAVEDGAGTVDADWDDWNAARDELWTKKITVKGASTQYLPPNLSDDSYDLDQNGSWETVDYEGQQRTMWRPTTVDNDWAPFTRGRWTEWNDDNCWVPEESFGYVTHHYGNWVRVESCGCWYWAPPMPRVQVVAAEPAYDPCTCWYPGRVAWISSGEDIGWVPLAPMEPYYSHHYWGPRAMVVAGVGFAGININIGSYRWLNSAVIVNQRNFYSVNNYSRVRITNINRTTIINNYRSHAVVNDRVMSNYRNNKQRFNFNNDIRVTNKPHGDVVRRIDSNRRIAGQTRNVNASGIERRVSGVKEGQLAKGARIKNPSITNKIVPAGDVNKPRKEIASQKMGLKKNERQPREVQTGNRGTQGQRGEQGKGGIKSPRGTGQVQGQPSAREQRQQLQQEKRQQQQSPRQQQMEQRKQQQQNQKQQQMEKQNQRQQQQREKQQSQRQQQMEQRKQQQQNQKQQQMEKQNQRQQIQQQRQQQQQQRQQVQQQRQQQQREKQQSQRQQVQQQRQQQQQQKQQVQQQRQQQQREKQQSQRQQVQQQRQQQQQQKQQVQQQRQQQQQQKRQQSQQGQKRKSQEVQ